MTKRIHILRLPAQLITLLLVVFLSPAYAQEMRTVTDNSGAEISIPVNPMRIVALNDQIVGLPLIEMGAAIVGSAGRIDSEGTPFMRGGMDTLGVDFSNSDIAFVGTYNALDIESIAALEPDLIIGGTYTDVEIVAQLSKIAPTLVINNQELGFVGTMAAFADAVGTTDIFEERLERYQERLAQLKANIGTPENISVTLTFMFPGGDKLWVYRSDGSLGATSKVMQDLGVTYSAGAQALEAPQGSFSVELIESLNADFVFGFYRQSPDATAAAVYAAYENWAPGWCSVITACGEGRFILLPGPAFGSTMTSLELALELVESHLVSQGFVSNSE